MSMNMVIYIGQWAINIWLNKYGCPANIFYLTTVAVDKVPFFAEFSALTNDITIRASIQNHCRRVTVIPNNTTDTNVADKLIVEAFQSNPALRYLVERSGKS